MGSTISGTPATGNLVVTLAEAKTHIRVDISDDNTLITSYIQSATDFAETFTARVFLTTTLTLKRDRFPRCPSEFLLPRPPLQSITSITYTDTDGDSQTVDSSVYDVDTFNEPGRITMAYNQIWPQSRGDTNNVVVTYVGGYGAPDAVSDQIKTAIKMLVGHWYEHREPVVFGTMVKNVPITVDRLLTQYKVTDFRL